MNLALSASERAFREELRGWLGDSLPEEWRDARGFDVEREWQRRLHAGRWVGVHWPRAYGGRGASPVEALLFVEELALARAPEIANRVGVNLVGPTLIAHGTEAQRARFLGPILAADEIWCQLYSEPGAGSDLAALETRAETHGDAYIVTGQKVWSSYAREAGWGLALVRTDAEALPHRGITCLLVPMDAPGLEVRPLRQLTGSAEFNEVFLDGVRVDASLRVGAPNDGWRVAMTTLAHERGVGFPVKEWAVQRVLFDRSRRLARTPGLRDRAARLYTDLEVLRLLNLATAGRMAAGAAPGPETSITKLHWARLSQALTEFALAGNGPAAVEAGFWSDRHLWSRAASIAGGTDEVQRTILAERVLGMPAS